MGKVNRRSYLLAIVRHGGEALITSSLGFLLFGLLLGVWEGWGGPFRGSIILLVPITYVMSRAIMSLFRVYQQVADLLQGPITIVGYITLHDRQNIWQRGRVGTGWQRQEAVGQRLILNFVPAEAFARWVGKPEWQVNNEPAVEAQYRYDPDPDSLVAQFDDTPTMMINNMKSLATSHSISPLILEAPQWAFEMVRLGDLIRLTYARRTRRIYNIEVMLSVLMPE